MSNCMTSVRRRAGHLLPLIAPLLAISCSDDSSPLAPTCVVDGVTVTGLPEIIAALESVQLTAQVEGTNCDEAPVTWSAEPGLDIDVAGRVVATHLGGPFTVTATAGGEEGTAETTVRSANTVPDSRWALAWMHNHFADEYEVDMSGYTYAHSTGGSIRSVRSGPGQYVVTFEGLAGDTGQREAIHLSAYLTGGPRRCRVLSSVSAGPDLVVGVRCDDLSGTPADSRFDILVTPAGSTAGRSAFLVSASPQGEEVPAILAHNSALAPLRVNRTDVGRYSVILEGLARTANPGSGPETFHVTAYGDGTEWCKIDSWGATGESDLAVYLRCFTPAGTPTDAPFSVLMLERERPGGTRLGFVWANNATSDVEYTPSGLYSYNSSAGINRAIRLAEGIYDVRWNGLARIANPDAETNLVTAYGNDATYCQVDGWGASSTGFLCYAPNGAPTSSRFTAIWIE